MQRHLLAWFGISLTAAVAFVASGCGGGTDCGPGTVKMDGECVPESEVSCGEGTELMDGECVPKDGSGDLDCGPGTSEMDGECVADGSMICTGATRYDPESGECVLDESACAEGTVLQDGECVPFGESLEADVTEPEEPNGLEPGTELMGAMFTLPEAGADPISMKGCIQPQDFDGDEQVDIDTDAYRFSVSQPTRIDVRVDGVGGLSGAFRILGANEQLAQDGWERLGLDLTSDESQREVFLPAGGDYVLLVSDGRSVFLDEPVGSEETCYYAEVSQLEIPAPTELTLGETETGELGAPVFYSTTSSEAQVLASQLAAPSSSAQGALVHTVDNMYDGSGAGQELTLRAADLPADGNVMVVVDHTFNISLDPVPYQLTVTSPEHEQMPEDGDVTLTHSSDTSNFLRFDGAAGDVVHIDFDGQGASFALDVFDPDGEAIGSPCGGCETTDFWLQLTKSGTHYVGLSNLGAADGDEYDVSVTRTNMTPTELSGDSTEQADLGPRGRTFFAYSTGSTDWGEFVYDNFMGTLDEPEIRIYLREQAGVIDDVVTDLGETFQVAPAEGDTVEHIYSGINLELLLSVEEAGEHDGDEALDVTYQEQPDYEDLGMLDSESTVDLVDENVPAGEVNRYFATGEHAALFEALADNLDVGSGLNVERLGAFPNAGEAEPAPVETVSDGETLETRVPRSGWVAYRISGASDEEATYDFSIDVTDPAYTMERIEDADFTNICPAVGGSGEIHPLGGPDDAVSESAYTLSSFSADFFGTAVDGMTVSSNGWMTFDTAYGGDSAPFASGIPAAGMPNDLVAPFWRDLQGITVCIAESADTLTVQWLGETKILAIRPTSHYVLFQAKVHSDGTVETVFSPGHVADGTRKGLLGISALMGIENADGSNGLTAAPPVAPGEMIRFSPTSD